MSAISEPAIVAFVSLDFSCEKIEIIVFEKIKLK